MQAQPGDDAADGSTVRPPAVEAAPLDARAVELLSHELRSPITTIHLGAKVLRSSEVRAPVREAVIEAVDIEADRLLRVVEDLLAVVRHASGATTLRVEPLLLQRWLPDLLAEGSPASPGVRIRAYLPDDLPPVLADDSALRQAVRNLVLNAARHGASGHPTEVVAAVDEPGWVVVRVLDRGPGIDPDEAERLFEPFYRSVRSGGMIGAGLGLAAARRLVRAMGGTLEAGAREGGGAVFTIRLRAEIPED
jgi:two-component system, OmpR family, sensor histidine kinase KdpD